MSARCVDHSWVTTSIRQPLSVDLLVISCSTAVSCSLHGEAASKLVFPHSVLLRMKRHNHHTPEGNPSRLPIVLRAKQTPYEVLQAPSRTRFHLPLQPISPCSLLAHNCSHSHLAFLLVEHIKPFPTKGLSHLLLPLLTKASSLSSSHRTLSLRHRLCKAAFSGYCGRSAAPPLLSITPVCLFLS